MPPPVVSLFEGGSALSDFRARQLLPTPAGGRAAHRGPQRPLRAPGGHRRSPSTTAARERFAALLGYGEPFVAPAKAGTDGGGHAPPGHGVALGLQGHRHRPQLRPGAAPGRARDRVPPERSRRPLIGKAPVLEGDKLAAVADLLHDRMTESVLARLEQAAEPVRRTAAAADGAGRRAGRRPGGAGRRPTAVSAWPWPRTRSTTWSTPSPAWAATRATSS